MVAISRLLVVLTTILPSSFAAPTELVDAVSALDKRGDYNFVLNDSHPLALARRNLSERSTNYVQNYKTGGTVNFSPSNGKFTVNWNTRNDFVVGVGWNPGSAQPITHSGSFSVTSGLGSLSVYGWTTNPLIEYYVIESLQGWSQNGQQMGTVTSDGGTYTIWKHQQVNQPSIEGTSTFWQYISVRNSPRTSGTVTLANHFNAWKSHGMNLGKMNFQVIAVETWNGAGSATQTVSN